MTDKFDIVAENYKDKYQGLAKEIFKEGLKLGYEKSRIDAEPVRHGMWDFIGDQMFQCTQCGIVYSQQQLENLRNRKKDPWFPNYCPNCGAKMDEVTE